LVPVRAGNRVKTNRRDAVTLARLHRAGELTAIWIPDPTHEAMRDLIRASTAAMETVRRARQQLQGFLRPRRHPDRQPNSRRPPERALPAIASCVINFLMYRYLKLSPKSFGESFSLEEPWVKRPRATIVPLARDLGLATRRTGQGG
jgi:hypothetical protein